uniref:Uncharacterized protein n=1 Tax=Anopheles maculatus TaxID=74869 RepID=A0A182T7Z4_9DIPT
MLGCRPETSSSALESQLVSAFRAAALPDNETLDLRQPSPLSPGSSDPHGTHQHPHHHPHHHHHHHQQHHPGSDLALPDYPARKRSHRHTDLPNFFQGTPGGDLVPGPKKAKFSAAATAAAAAVAANYYDNAYLSFEKSLRGAFGGVDGMGGGGGGGGAGAGSLLDGSGASGGGGSGAGSSGALDPYAGGHHLLSPINYTLTAEAINRRIRSTLGLDDQDQMERALAMNNNGNKSTPDDCCPGIASPDWIMRRSGSGSTGGPALADTRIYTHSPLPPGTPGTLYEEHKFAPFSPTSSSTLHDDNNNVDKKAFQE